MPEESSVIDRYRVMLHAQRLAKNRALHKLMGGLAKKRRKKLITAAHGDLNAVAKFDKVASRFWKAYERASARGRRDADFAADPTYYQEYRNLHALLEKGENVDKADRRPPYPDLPETMEAFVQKDAWKLFHRSVGQLCAAWAPEHRLLAITVTVRDDPKVDWQDRYVEVTKRLDLVMKKIRRGKHWSFTVFDVQGGPDREDLNPHWHSLVVVHQRRLAKLLPALASSCQALAEASTAYGNTSSPLRPCVF